MSLSKLEEQFIEFHKANPHVYQRIDHFMKRVIERGYQRFSINMIFERIRWETMIETSGDGFKVNNNYRPYYARLWMKNNPEHGTMFETRALLSKNGSKQSEITKEIA